MFDTTSLKRQKMLAEICGIHAGDGYLRHNKKSKEIEISGHPEEKEYYDNHVIPLFNNFFNVKIKGKYFLSKGTYGFHLRNKKVTKFMINQGFPSGKKTLTVKIPNFILENKKLKESFLRGYFDTDGCLTFNKKYGPYNNKFSKKRHVYPRLHFSTVSKNLANDLKKVFQTLNKKYVYYTYKPKKITENLKHKFDLNGIPHITSWMKEIGIKNPTKHSRYQIWKKFKYCPTNTSYTQRLKILNNTLNPEDLYKDLWCSLDSILGFGYLEETKARRFKSC